MADARRVMSLATLMLACATSAPTATGPKPATAEGKGANGSGTQTGATTASTPETSPTTTPASGADSAAATADAKDPKGAATDHLAKGKELLRIAVAKGEGKKPFAGAIAELEEAIALDPSLAEAHFELGRARFFAGNREEAIASFANAVAAAPNTTLTYYDELAQAEIAAGTPERALQVALAGEKHAPAIRQAAVKAAAATAIAREDEALYRLLMVEAVVYEAQGKKDLRIAALEKTHDTKSPETRDADYQLALAYHVKGDKAAACTALARFVASPVDASPVGKDATSIGHHKDARMLAKKWGCPLPKPGSN